MNVNHICHLNFLLIDFCLCMCGWAAHLPFKTHRFSSVLKKKTTNGVASLGLLDRAYNLWKYQPCESIKCLWVKSLGTKQNFEVVPWKEKHTLSTLEGRGHQNHSSSSGCNETPQGVNGMTWHLEEMLDNCHPQFWNDGWLTNSTASQGDSLVGRMIHMRIHMRTI